MCLCVGMHLGNRQNAQTGSRRQRTYSVGLGRRRTSKDSEEIEDTWNSTGRTNWMIPPPIAVVNTLGHQQSLYLSDRDDTPASPCSLTSWDSSKYCCRVDPWKHWSVSVVFKVWGIQPESQFITGGKFVWKRKMASSGFMIRISNPPSTS